MSELLLRAAATLACGIGGAFAAKKLRLPAPYMTGALLGSLLLGVFSPFAFFPAAVKPVVQAVAGCAVGANISREAVKSLRTIAVPVVAYVAFLIAVSTAAATLMTSVTSIDPTTSLLACAPGGIVDMSLLSYDVGGNTSQVALLQMARLIVGIGVFPSLTRVFLGRFDVHGAAQHGNSRNLSGANQRGWRGNYLPTLLAAAVGGGIGLVSGLPAGALSCSMLAVAALNVRTGKAGLPPRLLPATQVIAGVMAGSGMTPDSVKSLAVLLAPMGIVLLEYMLLNYVVGPFLARAFRMDLTTTLLACTPAGVSEMALIAGDMGGDQAKVAVFQLMRLVSVLVLFPFLVRFFAGLF